MLTTKHHAAKESGFTLIELMVAGALGLVVAGLAAAIHLNALDLFQKNGAINLNHERTRKIIDRLEKEIQSAISIPALVATNRDVIDSTGPAPGIAFLRQSGAIRQVVAAAPAGTSIIKLNAGPQVTVGQRLLLPAYEIEGDVTSVDGDTVTIAGSLPMDVNTTSDDGSSRNITAIITDLISYVVVDGELREYPNAATNDYITVATGITEPNPFGVPFNVVPSPSPSP